MSRQGHYKTLGTLIGRKIELSALERVEYDEVSAPGRPFTDNLPSCEQKWNELLAGLCYQDARVQAALYTYEASGLPATAL